MKPARENLAGFIVYMKSRESFVISDGYIIPLRSHPAQKNWRDLRCPRFQQVFTPAG